uniref:Protein DIS3 homolog n=1 Tax=Lepeophtheirus salmonis TaxID=72036 RepID=A0A0K2TTP1_LEPSM
MLRQKVFYRKTRRGRIMKIVREHYLRDDIKCGFPLCTDCHESTDPNIEEEEEDDYGMDIDEMGPRLKKAVDPFSQMNLLSCEPRKKIGRMFPNKHYLLIDTNIVLEQIDVLESLSNVIVLQTVLEEVRHRSSPLYKRLKDLIDDPSKHFYSFVNVHHMDVYVARNPGESPNDHNDRSIRRACEWYSEHLRAHKGLEILLLSDDVENRARAAGKNYRVSSLKAYAEAINDPSMMDKLRRKDDNSENPHLTHGRCIFPEHLSFKDVNRGIKEGRLHQGTFYLSSTNYLEGTVNVDSMDKPILIQGLSEINRSVDGDSVAVQLFEKSQWSAPSEVILEDEGADDQNEEEKENLDLLKKGVPKERKEEDLRPSGRVVGIIRRKWRQYCGILQPSIMASATKHLFIAAEKKIPKIRIETRQAQILKKQKIIVAIDSWPRTSRYPLGHFVRALGPIGDKSTENEVLLLEHDIPHSSFSQAVEACLPTLPWKISPKDEQERVDLRDYVICSVDPPGCTDIDDALHCRTLPNGNFEVGVHIADVSHFIRPGTAIDKEAALRSTTVYLTDRRIDMVPELLSSNLCSLRGGVDRFAFSCIWEVDPETAVFKSTKFHKSIICSKKAMTYEQAQITIDDPSNNEELAQSLRRLLKLAKILKKKRMDDGALILASSEVRFTMDSETADPIDVQTKAVYETNSMVEEFMLAANIAAASHIFENFPECAMLRRHPAPPPSNFDSLVKAGKQCGFEINVGSNKEVADSLNAAMDSKNPYFNTMLRMIGTRCMMQAVYFASGTIEEALFEHYGLAVPIYTHFTSPIRRYADIIVHRLLAAYIGADATYQELLDKKSTQNIANNINYRHRMAQYASRASVNLHTHVFFRNRVRDETGYTLFIRQNAIQVLIPKYGLEGTLYLPRNGMDFHFDESIPSQSSSGVTLTLFQKLTVQLSLDSTNVQHEKLILKLVHPVIKGFSVDPSAKVEEDQEEDAHDRLGKRKTLNVNEKKSKRKK